jgi:sugar/nucleoside kinase (ribokinase family)
MAMNILVAGHFCLDVIHPPEGPRTESYGGLYYSMITLAGLLRTAGTVIPVFGVGKQDYGPLIEHLKQFENIDVSGIFKFEGPTNNVELFYGKDGRKEKSTHIAQPIPYERIRRFLSVDGILVNMISGFDISLETLDQIRMNVRPRPIPIHLDFHSLTLGVTADHGRIRRPVDEWRRWAFMIDTVQLNEEEIAGLSAHRMPERELAGHLLTLGVKGVVVTKEERGATVYWNEKKKIANADVPAAANGKVADTTGCGDVFGAAFFLKYLKSQDLMAAATLANKAAGRRLSEPGSAHLYKQVSGLMVE